MLIAKQRGIDYRYTGKVCKNHNKKSIAKKDGLIVGKVCKKCGVELISNSRKMEGTFSPYLNGIIIKGQVQVPVKKLRNKN